VVADLRTDFPDRFAELASLVAVSPDGSFRSLQIEEQWFHGDRLVLKFTGLIESKRPPHFVGCDLAIPVDERMSCPATAITNGNL
jgi:ribosomal 30S subunit maturation factor RimM